MEKGKKLFLFFVLFFVGIMFVNLVSAGSGSICGGVPVKCKSDAYCINNCDASGTGNDADYHQKMCVAPEGVWRCEGSAYRGSPSSISKVDGKFCKRIDSCPVGLECSDSGLGNKCLCPDNKPRLEQGKLRACCGPGEVSLYPESGNYAKGKKFETSFCCAEGSTGLAAEIQRFPETMISKAGEIPTGCCGPNENSVYGQTLGPNNVVSEFKVCCAEGSDWDQNSEGCSEGCCFSDNDCSDSCFADEGYVARGSCKAIGEDRKVKNGEKGVCSFSSYRFDKANEILPRGKTCIERTVESTPENPLSCGPKIEVDIVCDDDSCNDLCEITENGRHAIRSSSCESPEGMCVAEIDRVGNAVRELCGVEEVCVENRPLTTPGSISADGLIIAPVIGKIEANCIDCPSSLSFGRPEMSSRWLWDGLEIKIGEEESFIVENTQMVPNLKSALKKINDVCGKCRDPDNKITVSFDGHLVDSGLTNLGNFPNIEGCVEKAIVTDCFFGTSSNPNRGILSNLLGRVPVIAGTELTTGNVRDGVNRCGIQILNEPTVYPGPRGTGNPGTIYYLADENDLYPGFGGEVYQSVISGGSLEDVSFGFNGFDSGLSLIGIKEENMPCSYSSILEENFIASGGIESFSLGDFSIDVLEGSNVVGNPKVTLRRLRVDCSEFNVNNPIEPKLISQEEANAAKSYYDNDLLDKDLYEDYIYRFENELECTADEHCIGLRCPLNDLNCGYSCVENECALATGGAAGEVVIESNSCGEGLRGKIRCWISGRITSSELRGAIREWISGGSVTEGVGESSEDVLSGSEDGGAAQGGDDYPGVDVYIQDSSQGNHVDVNGGALPTCDEGFDSSWCSKTNPNSGEGAFEFNWGDGEVSCSYFPASHDYGSSGEYEIGVRVKNMCGFIAARSLSFSV